MSSEDDLARWGLHLLQVPARESDCSSPCPCNCSCSADNTSTASGQSDEAVAARLQEQYYQDPRNPQIGNYFDPSSQEEDHQGVSYEAGDHFCEECAAENQNPRSLECAAEDRRSFEGVMGNSSSSRRDGYHHDQHVYWPGSPGTRENDEAIAAVLSEDYQQDGEVGRRLTHMESIPHVPKINGEIPSADAATLDHQRLIERLHVYGLTEHIIPGDGNCQFRALSDQFYRTPDHHMFVRKEVLKQLKQDPPAYEGYVPMKYADYLKKMTKNGEWGDHVTLQAAADAYGMKICLITSFIDTCIIDIVPKQPRSERVIFLSFWAEVHYNSVYPEGEAPVSYCVKKKKHWFSIFG